MADKPAGEVVVRSFAGGAFAENCYLLRCAEGMEGILVDPGAAVSDLLAATRQDGVQIVAIVLTHAHLDHVEGLAEARRVTGAPILLHAADEELYRAAPVQAQWFGMELEPLPPVDAPLVPGEMIRFGACALQVRFTPGHAPGHVILVGDGFAVTGDCVFAGSIGRTDLPGGSLPVLMNSIRSEILTLPDETVLHSGHGPDTSVGHERATNPFLAADWQGSTFA